MYHDLNCRCKSTREKDRVLMVKRVYELGYDVMAWTTPHHGKVTMQVKPIKAIPLDMISRREALQTRALTLSSPAEAASIGAGALQPPCDIEAVRQLSRLCLTVDELVDAQTLTVGNEALLQFDIVSVAPGNAKVFSYLCKTAEIDLISLDFSHKLPFALNKKLIDEAVKRGLCFEISYCALIASASGPRREIMSNTRTLVQYLRGKHIVLTSGAETLGQIRGPLDVANMAAMLGLSKQEARKPLTQNCSLVLQHAASRKLRHLPMEVLSTKEFGEKWGKEIALLSKDLFAKKGDDDNDEDNGGSGSSSSSGGGGGDGQGAVGSKRPRPREGADGSGGSKKKNKISDEEEDEQEQEEEEENGDGDGDGDGDEGAFVSFSF